MPVLDTTNYRDSVSYSHDVADQKRSVEEILAWEASEYRRALSLIFLALPEDYQPTSTDPDELVDAIKSYIFDTDPQDG